MNARTIGLNDIKNFDEATLHESRHGIGKTHVLERAPVEKAVTKLKGNKPTQIAIEYDAPHWVILIHNPGQSFWTPLLSKHRFNEIKDDYGVVVKKRPIIESFASYEEAERHANENLSHAELTKRPTGFWASLFGATRIQFGSSNAQ
ncbi:hypothetical protein [Burkholderia phage BCSR5]|nr:hypothetical protein [Burkholderia phage BCSR5]